MAEQCHWVIRDSEDPYDDQIVKAIECSHTDEEIMAAALPRARTSITPPNAQHHDADCADVAYFAKRQARGESRVLFPDDGVKEYKQSRLLMEQGYPPVLVAYTFILRPLVDEPGEPLGLDAAWRVAVIRNQRDRLEEYFHWEQP